MKRIRNALTDMQVRKAKASDRTKTLCDGGGLYLVIKPDGAKHWIYRYTLPRPGRYSERKNGLGSYPKVSLELARKLRGEKEGLVDDGIDPVAHKSIAKAAAASADLTVTFEPFALQWYARMRSEWVPSHAERNLRRLEQHVFPYIGSRDIKSITPPDMLKLLRRIEGAGSVETAHRVMQLCGKIFRSAVADGVADRDVTRDIYDQLKSRKVKNHSAITDPKEIGPLLRAIDGYMGSPVTRAALKLAPLVFVRPGELRQAKWADINLAASEWRFVSSKTKKNEKPKQHLVPLSKQAVKILRELQPLTGVGAYVFPGARRDIRPMSENAVLAALGALGYGDSMTGHGFRAMARTVLDEVLGERVDFIEHQLAHAVRDPNGTAYNRTKFLPQRHAMMQKWADYLDTLRKEKPRPAKAVV